MDDFFSSLGFLNAWVDEDENEYNKTVATVRAQKMHKAVEKEALYGNAGISRSLPNGKIHFYKMTESQQLKEYSVINKIDQEYKMATVKLKYYGETGYEINSSDFIHEHVSNRIFSIIHIGTRLVKIILPALYKQYKSKGFSKTYDKYVTTGTGEANRKAFFKKITKVLKYYHISTEDYLYKDVSEQDWKYEIDPIGVFSNIEYDIIQELRETVLLYGDSIRYFPVWNLPISIKYGIPNKYARELNKSVMKMGNVPCVISIFMNKLISHGYTLEQVTIDYDERYNVDGMLYSDVQKYQNDLCKKLNIGMRCRIHDRNDNLLKTLYSYHKRDKVISIKFYQSDLHASVDNVNDVKEQNFQRHFAGGKWATQPTYLEQDEMINMLYKCRYKNPYLKSYSIDNERVKIYCFCTDDNIYLLDSKSSGLDRSIYPYTFSLSSLYGQEFDHKHMSIPIDHKFLKYFSKTNVINFKYENDDITIHNYIESSKCTKDLVGHANLTHPPGVMYKIDCNRAYTNYHKCDYAKDDNGNNYLPSVPWDNMYKCDNSIFKNSKDLCGHVFMTVNTPYFIANKNLSIKENMKMFDWGTKMYAWPLAKFLYDNCDVTVHGIIPSYKLPDTMKDQFAEIEETVENPKLVINSLIGRMLSVVNHNTDFLIDPFEKDSLVTDYKQKGLAPKCVEIDPHKYTGYDDFDNDDDVEKTETPKMYILKSIKDKLSHSKYTYLHNFIIACHTIEMLKMTKTLIDLGCSVNCYKVDSISFVIPLTDIQKTKHKINQVLKDRWKWQEYVKELDTDSLLTPKIPVPFQEDLDEALVFNPILKNRIISINGPAGSGKTYLLNQLFKPDTVQFLAPTHSAKMLLPTGAKTYQASFEQLSKRNIARLPSHFILDECSMAPDTHLTAYSSCLKGLTKSNLSFGGLGFIYSGDACQIPPVSDSNDGIVRNIYETREKELKGYYDHKLNEIKRVVDTDLGKSFAKMCNDIRESILNKKYDAYDRFLDYIFTPGCKMVVTKPYKYLFNGEWTIVAHTNVVVDGNNELVVRNLSNVDEHPIFLEKTIKGVGYRNQPGVIRDGKIYIDGKKINKSLVFNHEYRYGYARTAHKLQGQTVKGKLLIVINGMINNPKMLYTCLTRVSDPKNLLVLLCNDPVTDKTKYHHNDYELYKRYCEYRVKKAYAKINSC